jgi:ABC-type Zn uptake system ZnuABC Zn-binding protein ZnuA
MFCSLLVASGWAKIKVVASTPDLASIATMIGGSQVEVESIAKGTANPHYVEVLPSYMVKVARADLYLKVGMYLDQWADLIIDGSRNDHLIIVDCSQGIDRLQVPTGKVDASLGDVHPLGNPHYALDPANGLVISDNILEGLKKVDPKNSQLYEAGFTQFKTQMQAKMAEWDKLAAPLKGLQVVCFHDDWVYFEKRFGLDVVGYIEPKPGIEPTPSHTHDLIEMMKDRKVRLIAIDPYYSDRVPNSVASATGAKVVVLPSSVGAAPGINSYFDLFEAIITKLIGQNS